MSHVLDDISPGAIVVVRDQLLKRQAAGDKVFRLESGDPSFAIPEHVRLAMEKALRDNQTHYTASAGITPLREAIIKKVIRENRLPVDDIEQVAVTNGAMHALYMTFRALLQPGDEVIIPDPMWTEIAENIKLAGGVPVRCASYCADEVIKMVSKRTKAVFINSPHNPTGNVLSRQDLAEIGGVASGLGLTIISDEAYESVLFDGRKHISVGSFPGLEQNVISIFSTSKTYAMSGLRIGYVVSRNNLFMERLKKLLRCSTNGVNSIAQHGAAAALSGPQDVTKQMCDQYQKRRDALLAGLTDLDVFEPIVPMGTFFCWTKITPTFEREARLRGIGFQPTDQAMTQMLLGLGVGSAPGTAFGPAGEGHIRFAFSCDTGQIEKAIQEIRNFFFH